MIESPVFQVVQINICEGVIGAKCLSIGIKGEDFINSVDAMKDGRSVVLVNEEGGLWIYAESSCYGQCKSEDY